MKTDVFSSELFFIYFFMIRMTSSKVFREKVRQFCRNFQDVNMSGKYVCRFK